MKFKSFKTLALMGAALVAVSVAAHTANAASDPDTDVIGRITTTSTLTAVKTVDMQFGTWLVGVSGTETPIITLSTAGTSSVTGATNSIVQDTLAVAAAAGVVTIATPTGVTNAVLQMTAGTLVDFPALSNLNLTAITYSTASQVEAPVVIGGAAVPVTVTTGGAGTAQPVSFGASITASDPVPDGQHDASFNVTFNY